eukprot:scaffold423039_cov48-Prasinocladus_malaysianus.AAC.1
MADTLISPQCFNPAGLLILENNDRARGGTLIGMGGLSLKHSVTMLAGGVLHKKSFCAPVPQTRQQPVDSPQPGDGALQPAALRAAEDPPEAAGGCEGPGGHEQQPGRH